MMESERLSVMTAGKARAVPCARPHRSAIAGEVARRCLMGPVLSKVSNANELTNLIKAGSYPYRRRLLGRPDAGEGAGVGSRPVDVVGWGADAVADLWRIRGVPVGVGRARTARRARLERAHRPRLGKHGAAGV